MTVKQADLGYVELWTTANVIEGGNPTVVWIMSEATKTYE